MPELKIGIWNAWLFMTVFFIQMAFMFTIGSNARDRCHNPEGLERNKKGKYSAITANILWFLIVIYSVFLPLKLWSVWFFIGVIIFVIGFIILILSTLSFIKTPPHEVSSSGVYQYSRHPMYVATLLICVAAGIASVAWTFIILCLFMFYFFALEAGIEEKWCLDHFGDRYRDYMNCTRRWI